MSLTSDRVKREMGYDTSKDKAMINEPKNIDLAAEKAKEGDKLLKPADK